MFNSLGLRVHCCPVGGRMRYGPGSRGEGRHDRGGWLRDTALSREPEGSGQALRAISPLWSCTGRRGGVPRAACVSRKRVARSAPARHPGARVTPLSRVPAEQQAFSAGRGQAAGADITRIATGEGWLYRGVILDLFARKNLPRRKPGVGWARRQDGPRQMAVQRRHPRARVASLIRIAAAGMPPETAARSGGPAAIAPS